MPPKTTFTKEKIIVAALELVRKNGISAISARNVAKALDSSVAPIYSCFSSTEKLKKAVLQMANNILIDYSTKDYTDKIFLNMGVGYVRFARDEKNLYRAIFLEDNHFNDISDEFFQFMMFRLSQDNDFEEMPKEQVQNLFKDLWIFVNGMANMICVGILKENSDREIIENLARVGAAIITSYLGEFDKPEDVKIYI